MPSPGQRGCRPPATSGARVQRPRSSCSPAPASPAPASPALPRRLAGPGPPRATGRLESSFSVEAILARPDHRAPAVSPLSVSAGAAGGLWTASSRPPAPVLPGACPARWLPAYLSAGLDQPCPQLPVLRLRAAHFCGLQGLGVPGTRWRTAATVGTGINIYLHEFLPFLAIWFMYPRGSHEGKQKRNEKLGGYWLTSPPANCSSGLELAHCLGLWGPRDWAQAQDLQDTERSQKRVRTMFNLEQLEELEKVFAKQHNLVGKKRAQLAAQLNLTENQVRVWFQNRRVKYQKQQRLRLPAASAMAASPDEPSSSSNTTIQREDAESGVDS
eukprot:bmy_16180T0